MILSNKPNNAADNFKQGLNCAESVFKAILDTGVAPDFRWKR